MGSFGLSEEQQADYDKDVKIKQLEADNAELKQELDNHYKVIERKNEEIAELIIVRNSYFKSVIHAQEKVSEQAFYIERLREAYQDEIDRLSGMGADTSDMVKILNETPKQSLATNNAEVIREMVSKIYDAPGSSAEGYDYCIHMVMKHADKLEKEGK